MLRPHSVAKTKIGDTKISVSMPHISSPAPQKFLNGEIHNWYRIVLGYSDHLVGQLLDRFDIEPGQRVLDPFCGAGTTLVECMKRGINCVGIDANPSSYFASQVKTNWRLRSSRLLELLKEVERKQHLYLRRKVAYRQDPTYMYLEKAGMIERGWISPEPLRKAIALKSCIINLRTITAYKNTLTLALIAEVVNNASNVKFGPEVYCGPPKTDIDVFAGFAKRVQDIAKDLSVVTSLSYGKAQVIQGDSRECDKLLQYSAPGPYSAVICSPPYPTEHDYTRNSRLELAFLEAVSDRDSLQAIKRQMIRSHTKGIYKGDSDATLVENHVAIDTIVNELRPKIEGKAYGFARLYPTVVSQYFGGMKRHLISVMNLLAPGAQCAYVLGDQSSYLQVHIPTAEILASIAEEVYFEIVEISHWRRRWSTSALREIDENILVFRKPG